MTYFYGGEGPWLLDCPEKASYGHVRDCEASAGEKCNHRGYFANVEHVPHEARIAAWTKLTADERRARCRAWRVAETLRKAK